MERDKEGYTYKPLFIFITLLFVIYSFAGSGKIKPNKVPDPSIEGITIIRNYSDLISNFLEFRDRNYPLVIPQDFNTDALSTTTELKKTLQSAEGNNDWYWTFNAGVIYFDSLYARRQGFRDGDHLIIYEDLFSDEIVILKAKEDQLDDYQCCYSAKAPAWLDKWLNTGTHKDQFWREISRKRIILEMTLRSDRNINEDLRALEESSMNFPPLVMMMGGGTPEHLEIQSITTTENSTELSISWPLDFTNRVDIYTCTDLISQNWELAETNLTTEGFSSLQWTNNTGGFCIYAIGNADTDSDMDNLSDAREKLVHHTNPSNADTDMDGLDDGEELTEQTNPLDPDSDDDTMMDGWEVEYGFNPLSDSDALLDDDNDDMLNMDECQYGFNPHDSSDALGDADSDYYLNVYECVHGSHALDSNSVPVPQVVVPSDGSMTIQQAINLTTNQYDIVLIEAGTYTGSGNKDISFNGKEITVISQDGPIDTVVDAEGAGRGFIFNSGETRKSNLCGLTIKNGNAIYGGGILCSNNVAPIIRNCVITENNASDGGGVYTKAASPLFHTCEFTENVSSNSGGGIHISYQGNAAITKCTIHGNKALNGGGIAVLGGILTVNKSFLTKNKAEENGGALFESQYFYSTYPPYQQYSYGSSITINDSMIEANLANRGAGIHASSEWEPSVYIYDDWSSGSITINRTGLLRNRCGIVGGAAIVYSYIHAEFENCLISENISEGGANERSLVVNSNTLFQIFEASPGIDIQDADTTVRNCTIINNQALTNAFGTGVHAFFMNEDNEARIINCIVWSNSPNQHQIFKLNETSDLYVRHCTHYDNYPDPFNHYNVYLRHATLLDGNITNNPQVTRYTGMLKQSSPCIDAAVYSTVLDGDINGEERTDGQFDIGCDEFIDADTDGLPDWWEAMYYPDANDDIDGDGLNNLSEYENGTNPNSGDTDGDGLNDDAELLTYGTDPENWDTDGDLISDGLEANYGFDPVNGDDLHTDNDSDGMTTYDELIYGTNPSIADTDGDGVNDGDEVAQGSDPNDNNDGGIAPPPEELVEVTLTVGDHSGSHSERYNMIVGPITHQAPDFGVVVSRTYKFRRGQSYPIQIVHMGSNLGTPDYDYTALAAPVNSGDAVIVADEENILGQHDESSYFYANGKTAVLQIPQVTIKDDPENIICYCTEQNCDNSIDISLTLLPASVTGDLTLEIKDEATVVKTFTAGQTFSGSSSPYLFAWDGKDNANQKVQPGLYEIKASWNSTGGNIEEISDIAVIDIQAISAEASDNIGPSIISYEIMPASVTIPSVEFNAPGITETKINVSGNFSFTYNQADLLNGQNPISLYYLGCSNNFSVTKTGISQGPSEDISIAWMPADQGLPPVPYAIAHQITAERYYRIEYDLPLIEGSYDLVIGSTDTKVEADASVVIGLAIEKHRYVDSSETYLNTQMDIVTEPTIPPTTDYRKYFASSASLFMKSGESLTGICKLESIAFNDNGLVFPILITNDEVVQSLE